jgi:hypothetical protein
LYRNSLLFDSITFSSGSTITFPLITISNTDNVRIHITEGACI